ncbi:retrovirus-related pol polyprotein from transposon TNT 1-94 [Tanacetum coccineum]
MTGNRKLFSSYKAYNGGNVIFGSNLRGNIIGKGQICDNKCRVTFSEHDSEITKDGKVIGRGYSQNSKAYIILNKHTRKVKESLNVTFDETPPPSKTSPLVDDDLDEEEAIKVIKKKNLENDIEDETLEIDKIVNIKESRNHPLENVIGNLNQRTLRSQAQNQSNFFCFISTIEPKNVNEALTDDSWIVAMQEELNQFIANDVWELVPQPSNMTIIGTKWVFRNKLDENGIVSRNKARILLAYACALDFKLFQMDVKSAFLNGFINEEVYVAQPPGFIDFEKLDHVINLRKLYTVLNKHPKLEMLKKFGLAESKPVKTPMSSDTKLTKDEECESVDSTKYRGMIGRAPNRCSSNIGKTQGLLLFTRGIGWEGLIKEFEEDLLTYCVENGIFQNSQDTFESSDDNTNVINALQEPIVVNQDPGVKSSQGPPLINQNCCYECGDSLDGFFCQQCICKFCGKGAHYGYNCPPKVSIISNPEQCNQTINELPQILPSVHPTCNYEDENSFIYDSKPHSFNVSPSVLTYPPQLQFETYLCELCGNNAHYGYDCAPQNFSRISFGVTPKVILIAWESFGEIKDALMDKQYQQEDIQELMSKLLEDVPKVITPDEPYEEPKDPLIMGEEELSTIFENDKSSVEDLIPIPSGSKGVSDDIYDNDHSDAESLHSRDIPITSLKINFLSEEFAGEFAPIPQEMDKDEVDCYDHDISSDDNSYENIEYVEASLLNLEYDSLEEENEDQEEKEFDLEDIFQIQDVILREKLLNVHRLITNIESLKNNPTPDFVFKSPSSFPIPVVDSDSFFEESDISLSYLDNSLPEFETFSDHTEETRSGRLISVVISDNSTNDLPLELPDFESFHFDPSFPRPPPEPPDVGICLHFKPDAPVIDNFNELNDDQEGGEIDFSQNVEDDDSYTFVIQTFLPFLTYPKVSLLSCSTGSEDTIFDPGYPDFEDSRAYGFVHLFELHILSFI